MRPTKAKPVPSESTNNLEQKAFSPRGAVVLDPSSLKPSPFPDPPSPKVSILPGPSSARGSIPPHPSSAGGPSSATGPIPPDPPSARGPSSATGSTPSDPSSARGPSSTRGPIPPDPSSARGPSSATPDPSSARGPSSTRGSKPQDPSSARGPSSAGGSSPPDPSSTRGSLFPDPSSPKGPPLQDSSPCRASLVSDSSSFRHFLSPESFPPRRSISLNIQPSNESMEENLIFLSGSLPQMHSKRRDPVMTFHVPIIKAKELKNIDERPNWLCATIALLLICTLLLALVCLMSIREANMEKKSREQMEVMVMKVRVLSETLTKLQMGKTLTCGMCRIQWVQRANLCFWFSNRGMSWNSSKSFCMEESSTLAIMETKSEMDFLLHESNKYFILLHGKAHYYNFWVGLEYNSTSLTLRDGTRLHISLSPGSGLNPCIYLRNGEFFTRPCRRRHNFICKTKAQFGWN